MKKVFVVDSSVAVKWLNSQDEQFIEKADEILRDVQSGKASILMPELAKYKISNALIYKEMALSNTLGSISTLHNIPIHFVAQDVQQALGAARIAIENKITFYDASFVQLAIEQKADLITDNPKHQNKKIKGLKVISIKNY
jgi:predicted nucleic acid-binding protein